MEGASAAVVRDPAHLAAQAARHAVVLRSSRTGGWEEIP
jgi:hypothetical protein